VLDRSLKNMKVPLRTYFLWNVKKHGGHVKCIFIF